MCIEDRGNVDVLFTDKTGTLTQGRIDYTRSIPAATIRVPIAEDEHDLYLAGLLIFRDPPKRDAASALQRLATLGIAVKVVTGDNPAVAVKVCHDLGLAEGSSSSNRWPPRPW